jgi:hypothetical protein
LAGCLAGCASNARQPERITESDSPREPEQVASRSSEPVVSIPSDDAPGRDLSGLPRYPGSVRVEYERGQRGGLEMVRARYLTRDGLDAVRGYYRGVFRAEEWEVANAEFYEDEWTFLVLHGDREADVEIETHEGDVTGMDVELTEPLPEELVSKNPPPKPEPAQKPRSAAPSAAPSPEPSQSATPAAPSAASASAPASARPSSPAPGYYGDDGDDFGDDGGGDD